MLSGGLDSTLAAKVLVDLGVEVEGVNFSTGFCVTEHTRNFRDRGTHKDRPSDAFRMAENLGIRMHIIDISKDYLPVVQSPKYGYGANMNPCVDCRIFMFKRMRKLMDEYGAHFMFTGEVLGQRPFSQHKQALKTIETESGLTGLILRPLSAAHLDPTIPEVKGWVDRAKLMAINGRSRKPQEALAKEKGLEEYPQPAGGCCFLADPGYSLRLRDFFTNNGKENLTHEDVILLKVGRHLRLSKYVKIIVGRNERENNFLKYYEKKRHSFSIPSVGSAFVLAEIKGELTPQDSGAIARIAARYSDAPKDQPVAVEHGFEGRSETLQATAYSEDEIKKLRIN